MVFLHCFIGWAQSQCRVRASVRCTPAAESSSRQVIVDWRDWCPRQLQYARRSFWPWTATSWFHLLIIRPPGPTIRNSRSMLKTAQRCAFDVKQIYPHGYVKFTNIISWDVDLMFVRMPKNSRLQNQKLVVVHVFGPRGVILSFQQVSTCQLDWSALATPLRERIAISTRCDILIRVRGHQMHVKPTVKNKEDA